MFILFSFLVYTVQAEFDYEYLFLKQFGYLESSDTPSAALLREAEEIQDLKVGAEQEPTTEYELPGRLFDPNTIKTMQLYAGLNQTGMIDENVIKMMRTPRCQNPDVVSEVGAVRSFFLQEPHSDGDHHLRKRSSPLHHHHHHQKRSSPLRMARAAGAQWDRTSLTYSFRNVTAKNARTAVVIGQAFSAWAECSQLEFTELGRDNLDIVDIDIKFVTGHHPPPASDSFDGEGGVLAHAWYPPIGHAHFDDAEDWSDDCFLYSVALHEIGHVLGLDHSPDRKSVMFAYFSPSDSVCNAANIRPLTKDDIKNIRKKYGAKTCATFGDQGRGEFANATQPGQLEFPSTPSSGPSKASELPTDGPELTPSGTFDSGPDFVTTPGPDYDNDWQIDCGSIVDNVLVSPLYPSVYPNAVECSWTFSAPGPRDKVQVNFYEFNLEESNNCKYDSVAISGEGMPQPILLCGQREGSMIFDTNNITVVFRSDDLKQYKGFKMYLSVIEAEVCEAEYSDSSGIITSPNYPEHYTPNMICTYTVTSPPGTQAVLVFEELDHTSCTDQIVIQSSEGVPTPPSCGNHSTPIYYTGGDSGGDSLIIRFSAKNKKAALPFRLRYFTVATDHVIEIVSESASYSYESPGYSTGTYNHSTDLLIAFTATGLKEDDLLEVQFVDMDIETDKYCTYDYLQIFTTDNKSGRLCGAGPVPTLTTTSHQIYLHFHSDGNVAKRGFKLNFSKQGCDANVTGDGVITSPNYPEPYSPGDHCVYTFGTPAVQSLYLVCFEELETGDNSCSAQTYRFFSTVRMDSYSSRSGEIIQCGDAQMLRGGEKIDFHASNNKSPGYYKLNYYKIDAECSYDVTRSQTLTHYSAEGVNKCVWLLRGDWDVTRIEVEVSEVRLTGKVRKGCIEGSLSVEDRRCDNVRSHKLCKKEMKNKQINFQDNYGILKLETAGNQLKLVLEVKFVKPVKCQDVHSHCYRFHKKYCRHSGYASWMSDNCRKYCNQC